MRSHRYLRLLALFSLTEPHRQGGTMSRRFNGKGVWLAASAIVLAICVAPFALAAGENTPVKGGARNPSNNASLSYTKETQIIANTSTYGTRQSNKSDNGGGAIYGCRSKLGGTEKGNQPCVRGSNLADGRAFEFSSNGGTEVGQITSANANAAPFITTAHAVATGLNADQVDGKHAADITSDATKAAHEDAVAVATAAVQGSTSIAAVGANGALGTKRGVTSSSSTGTGTYQVVFANDISACAIQATEATVTNAGAAAAELAGDKKTVNVSTRDN